MLPKINKKKKNDNIYSFYLFLYIESFLWFYTAAPKFLKIELLKKDGNP